MNVRVNKSTIELWQGDITELAVDGIVNAANDHLWMGAGVAGAIKRKGGQIIEQEAMAKGPIPVGEAVVTTAGTLKARYVIHAAAMGQDLHTDESKVRAATRNSLRRMEEQHLESIAFPALGTGVGGLSLQLCAHAMLDEAIAFLQTVHGAKRVMFALFDQGAYDAFERELAGRFSAR